MKVVVTGGGGFIGSAVIAELTKRGRTAISFDRRQGQDILTEPLPHADAVIHLAGMLGTAELFDQPMAAVDANVKGTLRVLQQCEVFQMRYVGITMPEAWCNVYSATKHCAVELALAWHRHKGVPVSHVRAFNAFGPGQAHGPGHPQKIVPTFATAAFAGEPMPIWGDGTQTVDLVYVDDIARMLCDALLFGEGQFFDAGTGTPQTVAQVAGFVGTYVSGTVTAQATHLPMRPGEDEHTQIVAKGEGWDLLGWRPRFNLQDFARTVESYRPAGEAAA